MVLLDHQHAIAAKGKSRRVLIRKKLNCVFGEVWLLGFLLGEKELWPITPEMNQFQEIQFCIPIAIYLACMHIFSESLY